MLRTRWSALSHTKYIPFIMGAVDLCQQSRPSRRNGDPALRVQNSVTTNQPTTNNNTRGFSTDFIYTQTVFTIVHCLNDFSTATTTQLLSFCTLLSPLSSTSSMPSSKSSSPSGRPSVSSNSNSSRAPSRQKFQNKNGSHRSMLSAQKTEIRINIYDLLPVGAMRYALDEAIVTDKHHSLASFLRFYGRSGAPCFTREL